jgi:hypothetical protein
VNEALNQSLEVQTTKNECQEILREMIAPRQTKRPKAIGVLEPLPASPA